MRTSYIYKVLIQIGLSDKKRLFAFHIFTVLLLYFLANPYVNNTGEFTQNTKYLLLIGMFFHLWRGYKLARSIYEQIDFEFIEDNKARNMNSIILRFYLHILTLFIGLQFAIMLLLYMYYCILFSSSWGMLLFISKLYLIYYALPFMILFIVGTLGGILQEKRESLVKTIGYLSLSISGLLVFILNEMMNPSFDIFIVNSRPYYNPLMGIENINLSLVVKGSFLLIVILLFLFFYSNIRGKIIFVAILTVGQIIFVNYVYKYPKNFVLKEYYLSDYIDKYEQTSEVLQQEDTEFSLRMKSIDVDTNGKEVIKFFTSYELEHLESTAITVFLNPAFEVVNISSEGKELDFVQKGSKIRIELRNKEHQVINMQYQTATGTSLNPVNSYYSVLPYFYQWLPSNRDVQDYYITPNESIGFKNQYQECHRSELLINEWVSVKEQMEGIDCISIFNGEFSELKFQHMTFQIPTSLVGRLGDYQVLEQELKLLQNEVCSVFKQPKLKTFCKSELKNIAIVPKYEVNAEMTYEDIWFTKETYFILINPYLNVNYKSLVEHISSLAIFNIPHHYLTVGDISVRHQRELTFLFAMYYMEKYQIDIKQDSDLQYLSSLISVSEYEHYMRSNVQAKKEYLITKYKEYLK